MEASRHIIRGLEDDEEHSSSESGWTMYIGSSIHEKDHYNFINGEYSYKQEQDTNKNQSPNYGGNGQNDDDESDDSMASDASSGQIHHKLIQSSSEQNLGMDHCKHDDETLKSISTEKVLHKKVNIIRRDQRRNKIGKEKLDQLKAISSAASHVDQSRGKVKITNYLGHKQ